MQNSPYRTFESFPLPWKAPRGVARFLQFLFIVTVTLFGFAMGLTVTSSPAEVPEPPPKPAPAMCYDTILTSPNDNLIGDFYRSYKCPFWDQSMHTITLKGEGAVACRCPNSQSTP